MIEQSEVLRWKYLQFLCFYANLCLHVSSLSYPSSPSHNKRLWKIFWKKSQENKVVRVVFSAAVIKIKLKKRLIKGERNRRSIAGPMDRVRINQRHSSFFTGFLIDVW